MNKDKALNMILAKLREQGVTDITDQVQVEEALKDVVMPIACMRLVKKYNTDNLTLDAR